MAKNKRRPMSVAARARISEAMKERYARMRRMKDEQQSPVTEYDVIVIRLGQVDHGFLKNVEVSIPMAMRLENGSHAATRDICKSCQTLLMEQWFRFILPLRSLAKELVTQVKLRGETK